MSRGGSRYGAGRPGSHGKSDNCRRIDVRRFGREDMLRTGSWHWQWTNSETGEVVSSIGIIGTSDSVTLDYSINGKPITQTIQLDRTACAYGGSRPWFKCPHCWGRVAILYLRQSRFACRKCQRLTYSSQSEDEVARMWRKQSKLEALLDPNWRRPKGMHRKTHETIMAKVWECEAARDNVLEAFAARLGFKL